jgi:hypothetical protein
MMQQYIIPVTPATVIPIVIGAAGVGGARSFNGGAGGDTLFNGVTLCFGGPGCAGGNIPYPSDININLWWDGSPTHTAGGLGGNGSTTNGFNGGSSGSYLGGAGGAANNYGGGGGASSYGPGGAGGTTGASALSTSYGAAGGGNYPASLLQAGNGAGGQLVIYY